ncbi:hypothetical protein [Micromonospora carbonacea]|uniref:Uncharacterized protein n=1 Tax=Micromonospora carbonacea TaxID=47853 RepID=A0A7H8XDP1_9ACTN|nr:hypothetical protein [Micromonospora carbonacea]MBB5827648.1 hypothetical protein [Micromonospora carbonacea]QLD22814.1 hypothetical protein HXZ27_10730 [Micromonospora carbonacea]
MLPVALTCPLWWVVRWTARMLATLAVVVAFSLGAAALPAGAVVPGGVDPGPAAAAAADSAASAAVVEAPGSAGAATIATTTTTTTGPWPSPAEAGPPPGTASAPQRVPTGFVPAAAGPRAPPAA